MRIIKSNTYNIVDSNPFDIPLPLEFDLLSGNSLLASYKIFEDGRVDYKFNSQTKERILTSTSRPLDLNDIYFLFTSRVFKDGTPFTEGELLRFGVEEYNPYDIILKTHGIMPNDRYWIRFAGDELTYKKSLNEFLEYFKPPVIETPTQMDNVAPVVNETAPNEGYEPPVEHAAIRTLDSILEQKSNEYSSINDLDSILSESKLDVNALAANIDDTPVTESVFSPATKFTNSRNDNSLPASHSEPAPAPADSGGNMSPDAIAALFGNTNSEAEPAPAPADGGGSDSGGNMSPDAIAALFGNTNSEAEPTSEPEPAPAPADSGGNMSPDAIAALFGNANSEAEPTSEPEPAPAPADSGGNMSPDAIAALFGNANSEAEPTSEPEPAPADSGGNMSPDAIAALFGNANSEAEPASEPEPAPAPADSGGNMSPDAIAALFANSGEG